jgi:hypothetical protein
MRTNFLNLIIIISFLGILIITARDYFISNKSTGKNFNDIKPTDNISKLITQTPKNNDPEIPCQNRYFNFKKGTTWRYKSTAEIDIKGQKQLINNFLTSKIIESSSSSIIIETQLDTQGNTDKKQTNVMICKKSGLYGFPFALLPSDLINNFIQQNKFTKYLKFNGPILFLPPDDTLIKNNQWRTNIEISVLGINIENRIVDKEKQTVLKLGNINTIAIDSNLNISQSILKNFKFSTNKIFKYQLGENVGIINFVLNLDSEELGTIKINLKLVDFYSF